MHDPSLPEFLERIGTVRLGKRDLTLLVIEVTSPDDRNNDLNTKLQYYYRAGVRQYVIVDRAHYPNREIALLGYVPGKRAFKKQQADSMGCIRLLAFDLWLGVSGGSAVLFDGDEEVPDYSEWAQRVEKERQRANAAEATVQALQAELERLRNAQS